MPLSDVQFVPDLSEGEEMTPREALKHLFSNSCEYDGGTAASDEAHEVLARLIKNAEADELLAMED